MLRHIAPVGLLGLVASSASANPRHERPMQLEVGFNTRHYAAAYAEQDVAFRGEQPDDPSLEAGNALSMSMRFTGRTRYNTYLGVEAEAGKLVTIDGSNLAGAYGVAGVRNDFGRLRIAAELVAGRRWVRYEEPLPADLATWIAEPRVRGDLWLGSQLTLGAAVGATVGDRSVWMAGVYVGVHAFEFDRW